MSTTVYNYQIYCITEGIYINGIWGTTPPTLCPHNSADTINPALTMTVGAISENQVVVRESTTPNGGNFMSETVHIDATANSVTTATLSYPFPIVALTCYATTDAAHIGDTVTLSINPPSPIALLASNVSPATAWVSQNYVAGDKVTYNGKYYTCIVNTTSNQAPLDGLGALQSNWWAYGYRLPIATTPTAMDYIYVGYYMTITSNPPGTTGGTGTTDELNRVLAIDETNYYLYLETGPTNSYSAGAAYIYLILYSIKDFELSIPGRIVVGAGKIGGKGISANVPINVLYNNKSISTNKTFVAGFEYLY